MAERFTIAIWTSTGKKNAKRIVEELFLLNSVKPLFVWYNPKCKFVQRHDEDITVEEGTATVGAESDEEGGGHGNDQLTITRASEDLKASSSSSSSSLFSSSMKPLVLKPLHFVWEAFPQYSEKNTVSA
jgi:hypothetical protein